MDLNWLLVIFHHLVDKTVMIFVWQIEYNIFCHWNACPIWLPIFPTQSGHFAVLYGQFDFWSVYRVSNCPQIVESSWDFTVSGKSFIWQRNIRGPNTVPCGTPDSTGADSECSLSTTTFICLSWRKELSHLCKLPLIPYASNLCRSLLWGTVSTCTLASLACRRSCIGCAHARSGKPWKWKLKKIYCVELTFGRQREEVYTSIA